MPRVELVKGKNQNRTALKNLINYAMDLQKTTSGIVGVLGAPCENSIQEIIQYFDKTQINFGKKKGRLAYHFVIALSPEEQKKIPKKKYKKIGYKIASFFDDEGFQTVFALHENTEQLHFHIVVNSVNYYTGKKYHFSRKKLSEFKMIVADIISQYLPPSCQIAFG